MRKDLRLHRAVGVVLPLFFAAVLMLAAWLGNLAAVVTGSLAVALAKEILDPKMGGQRDWKDAAYTAVGIAAGAAALYFVGWK